MPVTLNGVLQVLIFLAIVLLITKPMGLYMTAIFTGRRTWLTPVFVPGRAPVLPPVRHQPRGRAEMVGLCHRHAGLQRGRHAAACISSSAPSSGTARSSTRRACPMSSQACL